MQRGLARHVAGCLAALCPAAAALSPAHALALWQQPLLRNWYQYSLAQPDGATGATHLLMRELFHQPTPHAPLKCTANPSLPAYHLTPKLLAHFMGLASTSISQRELPDRLRALEMAPLARDTGVSLARFARLVVLMRDSMSDSDPTFTGFPHHTWAVTGQLLWAKVQSKQCLADFLTVLETYLPSLRDCDYPEGTFDADFCSTLDFDVAALVAGPVESGFRCWARVYEQAVFAMASSDDPRPLAPEGRYGYKGQATKANCAERMAQEVLNHLLWSHAARRFCPEWLPASAAPELRDFYGGKVFQADAGQLWMDLCSNRPGVRYMAGEADRPYEVYPNLPNLLALVSSLLGTPIHALQQLPEIRNGGLPLEVPQPVDLLFEVDDSQTRIALNSAADDVVSHIVIEEPVTCFITRQLPIAARQKELQKEWAEAWVADQLPGHLLPLLPRVLQGTLVPSFPVDGSLSALHLAVLCAELTNPLVRLDALRLVARHLASFSQEHERNAANRLAAWLKGTIRADDLEAWRLARGGTLPESIAAMFGGRRVQHRKRGFLGGLPPEF